MANPHTAATVAGLQHNSAAQAALAASAAVSQQLGSQPDSAAGPGEESLTARDPDSPLADRVEEDSTASDSHYQMSLEVSLAAAMRLHLCTADLPDSRKGAQACPAATL